MSRDAAIGVFDSGLGGLTVAKAIRERLPSERLVYLGDTARVPYGSRSGRTVVRYARTCGRYLAQDEIKMIVVACNTVSAVALDSLRVDLDIPVVGVITPGAQAGVRATKNGRLGVIATRGTIASGAYVRAVSAESSRVEVFARPAPLLVPLAEEGWLDDEIAHATVARYLEPFVDDEIDSLVLGCTHYPLLRNTIEAEGARLFSKLSVVDGAEATAIAVDELLVQYQLSRQGEGELSIRVTDLPGRFSEVAGRFLGEPVDRMEVEQVDLSPS